MKENQIGYYIGWIIGIFFCIQFFRLLSPDTRVLLAFVVGMFSIVVYHQHKQIKDIRSEAEDKGIYLRALES